MTPVRAVIAAFIACAALVLLAACSRDCTPLVDEGWVRWLPVEMPMTAGFVRIDNPCSAPLTVVGASSPVFADVSLHETRIDAGVSRMRPVASLHVPAGGSVELQPGGLHLMMTRAQVPLTPGGTVRIDFALEDGRTLTGEMLVRSEAP